MQIANLLAARLRVEHLGPLLCNARGGAQGGELCHQRILRR